MDFRDVVKSFVVANDVAPFTGASTGEIKSRLARVMRVANDSPAALCGVRVGDFLYREDGRGLDEGFVERNGANKTYEFLKGPVLSQRQTLVVQCGTNLGVQLRPEPELTVACIEKFAERGAPMLRLDFEGLIEALLMTDRAQTALDYLHTINLGGKLQAKGKPHALKSIALATFGKGKAPSPWKTSGTVLLQAVAFFRLGDIESAEQFCFLFKEDFMADEADSERFALHKLLSKAIEFKRGKLPREKFIKVLTKLTIDDAHSLKNFMVEELLSKVDKHQLGRLDKLRRKPHHLVGEVVHSYTFNGVYGADNSNTGGPINLVDSIITMNAAQLMLVVYVGKNPDTRVHTRFLEEISSHYRRLLPAFVANIHVIMQNTKAYHPKVAQNIAYLERKKRIRTFREIPITLLRPMTPHPLESFLSNLGDSGDALKTKKHLVLLVDKYSVVRAVGLNDIWETLANAQQPLVTRKVPVAYKVVEAGNNPYAAVPLGQQVSSRTSLASWSNTLLTLNDNPYFPLPPRCFQRTEHSSGTMKNRIKRGFYAKLPSTHKHKSKTMNNSGAVHTTPHLILSQKVPQSVGR